MTSARKCVTSYSQDSRNWVPVNLHRIVQNATQIFHIDKWKPRDLEPAYIVEAVQQLNNRLANLPWWKQEMCVVDSIPVILLFATILAAYSSWKCF